MAGAGALCVLRIRKGALGAALGLRGRSTTAEPVGGLNCIPAGILNNNEGFPLHTATAKGGERFINVTVVRFV